MVFMLMRTFIALELSEEVKKELSRIQEELKKADADIKWAKPDNIHLTLKFLGNVGDDKIEEIKKVLNGVSSQKRPFEINLSKPGAFPNPNYPRVIWVGIEKNSLEVEKIAQAVEGDLEKLEFPAENRPFSAHLTLGRVKSATNRDKLKQLLLSVGVRPKSCSIDKITLFQSTLTPKGPIYTPLHIAKFTAG